MIYLIVGWIVCGILAYGIVVGSFYGEFPTQFRTREERRTLYGHATLFALLGPMGLAITLLASGFVAYGIRFRVPPEPKLTRLRAVPGPSEEKTN